MAHFFILYLYNWNGLNQQISQKLHLLIDNGDALNALRFFTEYIGYYKMFPIHLIIIILIMTANLFIHKDQMSTEQLRTKTTKYFQLLSTLIITILCMAAAVGAAKEVFTLTRPLCMPDFSLSEYAMRYKDVITKTENMTRECYLSFPSGHSSYATAMLTALWGWFTKPFKVIGVFIVMLVIFSRIALGMHFIADVLFAVLMSVFIAVAVKHVMHTFFKNRHKKKAMR